MNFVGGISNFFSLLIKSFGYTPEQSLLYGTPGGAVEIVSLWIFALLADRLKNRIIVGSLSIVISILGMALIVGLDTHHNVGRLIGYYLTQAAPGAFVALLSLISTNVAGYTKKTTIAALYLIGYCAVSFPEYIVG
jgi:MFS transporter, ACS family, DAL5 transporter family protein